MSFWLYTRNKESLCPWGIYCVILVVRLMIGLDELMKSKSFKKCGTLDEEYVYLREMDIQKSKWVPGFFCFHIVSLNTHIVQYVYPLEEPENIYCC